MFDGGNREVFGPKPGTQQGLRIFRILSDSRLADVLIE